MGKESLIYSPTKKTIYLNETATVIWKLCNGKRTVKEITDLLADAFPNSASNIRADVAETLDALVRNGALQLRVTPES